MALEFCQVNRQKESSLKELMLQTWSDTKDPTLETVFIKGM
jgi:hypothetical protein